MLSPNAMDVKISHMDIILNQIALWRPKLNDQMTILRQPAGLRVLDSATKLYKLVEKPIIRYAKNYIAGKGKTAVKFSLFVRTYSEDEKAVESRLDEVAKNITVAQARKINSRALFEDFDYLNERMENQ